MCSYIMLVYGVEKYSMCFVKMLHLFFRYIFQYNAMFFSICGIFVQHLYAEEESKRQFRITARI